MVNPRTISYLLIAGWLTLSGNWVLAKTTDLNVREPALVPSTLVYSANYNGMPIEMTRELTVDTTSGIYQFASLAKNLLGKIEETGRFEIDQQNNLKNHDYKYQWRILGKGKTEELVFDYQEKIARYTSKDKHRQVKLTSHFQSRISYQLQLQRDLLNHCEDLDYQVIVRGKPRDYAFKRNGEETITTPLGDLNTVVIKRVGDEDRETTLWFAPALNYTLVRLVQKEDGEEYLIDLKEGSINQVSLTELLQINRNDKNLTGNPPKSSL